MRFAQRALDSKTSLATTFQTNKLQLEASKGMGVRIYSNDDNEDALQDITIGMTRFDLDKVLSVIPYMPDVSGIMNGDFHVVQTKEALSVSSNLSVDNLSF